MPFKRMKLGPIGFTVFIENQLIEKVRRNIFYRYFIRPIRKIFSAQYVVPKEPQPGNTTNDHQEVRLIEKNSLTINHHTNVFEGTAEQKEIIQRIGGFEWYHSINLGHGIVTPGAFNHQPHLSDYRLPERLDGLRVLDVATFDGFWAFEFERRGAAEVIAMDIESFNEVDLPPMRKERIPKEDLDRKTGLGFNIAKDILGSKVERKTRNIYALSPDWMGKFDMVFCSDLLLHLMNPMKALQNIYSVVSGSAIIVEPYDPELNLISPYREVFHYKGGEGKCLWWMFSLNGLEKMIYDAGFSRVKLLNTFELAGWQHAAFRAYK